MGLRILIFLVVTTMLIYTSNFENVCKEKEEIPRTPRIQVRAISILCPNKFPYRLYQNRHDAQMKYSKGRSREILQFYGYDRDEPLLHSEVIVCRKKFLVTVKLTNSGDTVTDEEYIVIDHVYDPVLKQRARLLHPVVIKLKQDHVMQAYPLITQHIVNAEAREEIYQKEITPNYKGCDTSSDNPTCGIATYDGKPIPFSEGFCCSCDSFLNAKRQPILYGMAAPNPGVAFSTVAGRAPQSIPRCGNIRHLRKTPSYNPNLNLKNDRFPRKCKDPIKGLQSRNSSENTVGKLKFQPIIDPLQPEKYYLYPPLEPAKGFRKSDLMLNVPDPWRPNPYPVDYNVTHRRRTYKPYIHSLYKRRCSAKH